MTLRILPAAVAGAVVAGKGLAKLPSFSTPISISIIVVCLIAIYLLRDK